MRPKFLITAGDFNELSGGVLALHMLCHLLNRLGQEAYICPFVSSQESRPTTNFGGVGSALKAWIRWHLTQKKRPLHTSADLSTPILSDLKIVRRNPNWIVIYPETVFGNPLLGQNVVRWLLHHPGILNGTFAFSKNELHIRYSDWVQPVESPILNVAASRLVVYARPQCYTMGLQESERTGTAYCLRKGKGREIVHSLDGSILIDGLPHQQVAEILKRVKTFISYDLYTSYSEFAAICGCDSVVVPDTNLSEEQWHSNESERWGIAYGFDKLPWARQTVTLLWERLKIFESESEKNVENFVSLCHRIFHFSTTSNVDL